MNELETIQYIYQSIGYKVERESLLTSEVLHVTALNDGEVMPYILAISLHPKENKTDDGTLIQFYFQYPLNIQEENTSYLMSKIAKQNRLLPIGHFNIIPDEHYIYFKYVLVCSNNSIQESILVPLMDIIVYTMEALTPS
jgi:hypothetical protein